MTKLVGTLFNIQRFSLHDGPGIRTTVFFKGCNLSCAWCHNPESFSTVPQISVDFKKCNGCGACVLECNVHKIDSSGNHLIEAENCTNCGKCVQQCPQSAITMLGQLYTVEQVMEVIRKDKRYYTQGGGVTFSGGEATLQFEFLLELLKQCKSEGISTCLETNGVISIKRLTLLAEYIDLFLLDFKHSDNELHKRFVGCGNKNVFESLELLYTMKKQIWLRCPIIPRINDTDDHFEAIKSLHRKYPKLAGVELMPYHDLGVSKWRSIGSEYSLETIKTPSPEIVSVWNEKIKV